MAGSNGGLSIPLRMLVMARELIALGVLMCGGTTLWAQTKADLISAIDRRADDTWKIARQIWEWAEPGYQEVRSAGLLADTLETAGFRVKRGVADIPTAFTATAGEGRPIIGLLGEYDALPGLAQEPTPERQPRSGSNGYGHGCGHHLFGSASLAAAIAVAEGLQAAGRPGTIRFYGCPAEEGGAAKAFMVRAGLFDDCDVVLHWHPSARNSAGDASCLARIAVKFRFTGKSAHAAGSPDQGRSAVDAVELTAHASELLREHTPDFTRIHHTITGGGGAPNVVPDFAEIYYYIRHPKSDTCRELYPRLLRCAEGAAHATETRLEVNYLGGTWELLPNNTLAEVLGSNLRAFNTLRYSPEEAQFALKLQESLPRPVPLEKIAEVQDVSGEVTKGSTDVGDVSWVVPTAGFSTACWVPGTPGHSWQAVACGATTLARQGMLLAAKVLAASAWDLFDQPATIAAAKAEHARRRGERVYEPLLLPGQKPPLDYRNAPVP
jgi:aminobenzoyl-glutamate utilization protein B